MKKKLFRVLLISMLGMIMFASGAMAQTLRLPKTLNMVMGFSGDIEFLQYNIALPSDYNLRIKPASVARLDLNRDENYVYVVPLKPGKATITLSAKGMKKASCKLTVHNNILSYKKPGKGKAKQVNLSVKRMRYIGDDLVVDMFVYNRTGKTLRALTGVQGQMMLVDKNKQRQGPAGPVVAFADWRPKGGKLKNGKFGVMTLKFVGMREQDGYQYMLKYPEILPDVSFN